MGKCGRCLLKQDHGLAEAYGETEEAGGSANLLTMIWKSDSVCATRAQPSANSASRTVFFTVFVLAVSRRR